MSLDPRGGPQPGSTLCRLRLVAVAVTALVVVGCGAFDQADPPAAAGQDAGADAQPSTAAEGDGEVGDGATDGLPQGRREVSPEGVAALASFYMGGEYEGSMCDGAASRGHQRASLEDVVPQVAVTEQPAESGASEATASDDGDSDGESPLPSEEVESPPPEDGTSDASAGGDDSAVSGADGERREGASETADAPELSLSSGGTTIRAFEVLTGVCPSGFAPDVPVTFELRRRDGRPVGGHLSLDGHGYGAELVVSDFTRALGDYVITARQGDRLATLAFSVAPARQPQQQLLPSEASLAVSGYRPGREVRLDLYSSEDRVPDSSNEVSMHYVRSDHVRTDGAGQAVYRIPPDVWDARCAGILAEDVDRGYSQPGFCR